MTLAEGATDMENKTTDQMIKKESEHPSTGPTMALIILKTAEKRGYQGQDEEKTTGRLPLYTWIKT